MIHIIEIHCVSEDEESESAMKRNGKKIREKKRIHASSSTYQSDVEKSERRLEWSKSGEKQISARKGDDQHGMEP